ncbi:hypothetical protein FB451DRAFT_1447494 [Mycena latifolia]|nr:hypothetical protein FB451DRAFT_1447494 [Mycena latifolia]
MAGGQLDSYILNHQAELHLMKSEYVEARSIQTQGLHAVPMEQNPYDLSAPFALITIAQIDAKTGVLRDGVHNNLHTARQLFSFVGNSLGNIFCDMVAAALFLNEGDLRKAMMLFQTCLKATRGKNSEAVSYCLEKLGNASRWCAINHDFSNWTVVFLAYSLKLKRKLEIYKALQFLGDVYLADKDQQTAINLLTVALEGFTRMDVHRSRGECMLRLGDMSELHGDLPKAAELWKTARALFKRSSQAKQVANIDERLARTANLPEHHLVSIVQLSTLKAPMTRSGTVDEDDIQPALIAT